MEQQGGLVVPRHGSQARLHGGTPEIGDTFYLLTDTGVECLSTDSTSQWTQSLSARPQGLLADRRQLLVFCGNTVQVLTPPAAENNAQSNT